MKRCPKCKADNPDDAKFCHMCGYALKNNSNILVKVLACFVVIAIIAGGVVLLTQINESQLPNNYKTEPVYDTEPGLTEIDYETHIRNTIQTLCDATTNNDYERIADVYAYNVKRYHGIYNVTKNEVIERYKNYDNKFGVYGKRISVRWNTLRVWKNSDGGYSVVYVEDYHIDRYDNSKYTDYVLEKHLELDEDYKVVSVYDNQLSKM